MHQFLHGYFELLRMSAFHQIECSLILLQTFRMEACTVLAKNTVTARRGQLADCSLLKLQLLTQEHKRATSSMHVYTS